MRGAAGPDIGALRRAATASGDDPSRVWVAEPAVKALLRACGVVVPSGRVVMGPADAATAAAGMAGTLVLKAVVPGLVHKSEAGAVALGLAPREIETRLREMSGVLRSRGHTARAFLLEEQCEPGVELLFGIVDRPPLGRCVALGLGGVHAEVLRDLAWRAWPVSATDVAEMLDSLRGAALLYGARGAKPVDREAVIALGVAVAGEDGVVAALGAQLAELELNPVIASVSGAVAVDARLALHAAPQPEPAPREAVDFTAVFEPKTIAVVGASATRRSGFGNMFLRNYQAYGYSGELYAIHPTAGEIEGVPAHASLAATPRPIDYALVAVPAARAAETLRGAAGHVRFAQVMSGGFAEAGPDGHALERELLDAARQAGLRLLGPNCMGVWCGRSRQTFLGSPPERSGGVSVISQSGGLAGDILKQGDAQGLGFASLATVGNSIDLGAGDLLRWLVHDPHTRCIGLYLEDPRDGESLVAALRAARGRKPVVLLVGGTSRQGGRAAASHTGAMAGEAALWRGVAAQSGAVLCESLEDFLAALHCLDHYDGRDVPAGPGVLVIGPGGGSNVLATDACDRAGLEVAPLPDALVRSLRERFPLGAGTSLANPIEVPLGPLTDPALAASVIGAVLDEVPLPDVLVHVNVQSFFSYADDGEKPLTEVLHQLAALCEERPRTRITVALRSQACAPAPLVTPASLLCFPTLDTTTRAIAAAKTGAGASFANVTHRA